MTGHLFGDRYQVGDTLGFGGMSEVHRGRDLRLGRDVAIKVLRADLARDPAFQVRFRREAQNAASLNHPAIVAVYDTGETPGEGGPIPYIVMEYVDGETLRDLLKREGPLQPKRAMEIVADVCAALDFSHRHGIVHRDIKPANIMLTKAGAVKVMDFGIARAVADGQATMTATAAVIGTAQYLSPEQARGEAVDARSDVYATGCVLFELLTGAPPFTGDSPVAVAYQHVREDPKAPSEVKPGLPRELDAIVLKALNKNPMNRYQTAAEMRSDLVRALSGQAVHATPIMPAEERTELMRPGPMRVGGASITPAPLLAPPRRPATQDMWEEDETPDRSKRVWGFVGIGALCLALLGGAIFLTLKLTNFQGRPAVVATPDLSGKSLADATKLLQENNLQVGDTVQVESADNMVGKVVKQNPSPGQTVDQASKVNLQIGKGVTAVNVPNLGTMTADQAKAELTKNKLKYKEDLVDSDQAHAGYVLGQDPSFGTPVAPGSTVVVKVGKGPVWVTVPGDLVGKGYDDAAKSLSALKLVPQKKQVASFEDKDKVLAVDPAPNTQQQQGQQVILTVSDNSQFKMPNVRNQTPQDALTNVKKAGWTQSGVFATQDRTVDQRTLVGLVVDQSVPEGTAIDRNAGITIFIGTAKQVVMPDLRGKSADQIADQMAEAGFDMSKVSITEGPVAPSADMVGKWASSSLAADGSSVDWDTPVQIQVYKAAPPPPTTSTAPTTPTSPPAGPTTRGQAIQPGR